MSALDDLWNLCYVANNEDEATPRRTARSNRSAGRPSCSTNRSGRTLRASFEEFEFAEPVPFVVDGLWPDQDDNWDHVGELIPEWRLHPADPDQTVVDKRLGPVRLGDCWDWTYFAPGIGTREGFTPRDGGTFIEPVPIA